MNLLNADSHRPTSEFINSMLSGSFYPVINKPTRITEHSATIIDNIFCNFFNEKLFCGILYWDISDHLPIFMTSDLKIERKQKHLTRSRNISIENINPCTVLGYNCTPLHILFNYLPMKGSVMRHPNFMTFPDL